MSFLPILLFGGSFIAGIINSVAGGGSLFIYPLLIGLGIPPIVANASTGVAVLPGTFSSAYGYREHLRKLPLRYYFILIPAIVGGLFGAFILRHTSNETFAQIVPWFILLGVALMIAQPYVMRWARKKRGHRHRNKRRTFILLTIGLTLLSVYGGYFGAGSAIVILAFLGYTELTDIHEMNGFKNLMSAVVNLASSLYLMSHGLVQWEILPWLLIGNLVGGWIGATYSSRLPKQTIRWIVISISCVITFILFART